ncbi:predicted protein [Lichtheimia corymbifera JMRC:FSU:9682]|uniref:Uncharacterized protein n=1 Tax=Lichtheimia corymbifera JMRC:FSU:9682 TaxID=1263082 RepID=A0A068RRL3_9FUNG|nr:predicted protein [Lichtheimia corymbifera JMRC:FSU:9682]
MDVYKVYEKSNVANLTVMLSSCTIDASAYLTVPRQLLSLSFVQPLSRRHRIKYHLTAINPPLHNSRSKD